MTATEIVVSILLGAWVVAALAGIRQAAADGRRIDRVIERLEKIAKDWDGEEAEAAEADWWKGGEGE